MQPEPVQRYVRTPGAGLVGHRADQTCAINSRQQARPSIVGAAIGMHDGSVRTVGNPLDGRGSLGNHILSTEAADYLVAGNFTVVLWTHVVRDRIGDAGDWIAEAQQASAECEWR